MKNILMNFAEWYKDNATDIFEIIDEPEKVIDIYLKEKKKNMHL